MRYRDLNDIAQETACEYVCEEFKETEERNPTSKEIIEWAESMDFDHRGVPI